MHLCFVFVKTLKQKLHQNWNKFPENSNELNLLSKHFFYLLLKFNDLGDNIIHSPFYRYGDYIEFGPKASDNGY